jgi:hypothetical protein
VKDYLPFGSGFSKFIEAYLIPSVTALGLFCFFLFPAIADQATGSRLDDLSTGGRAALFGVAALFIAFLVASAVPIVNGILSGAALPLKWSILSYFEKRQRNLWRKLVQTCADPKSKNEDFVKASRRLKLMPSAEEYVRPTRLGNRLKAAETFGKTRYRLDTPTLYYELRGAVGSPLIDELDRTLLSVQAFVGIVVLGLLFASAAAVVAIWATSWPALWGILAGVLAAVGGYYAAVLTSASYIEAMRALANNGRKALADCLGVQLPPSLDEERKLWGAISNYVYWGPGIPDEWANTQERIRVWDALRISGDSAEAGVDTLNVTTMNVTMQPTPTQDADVT